jgi:lysozyme family protein
MADYKLCIPVILRAEGELSDDPADAGGITKWGVCLRFAKDTKNLELFDKDGDGDIDRNDIKKLTIEDATEASRSIFGINSILIMNLPIRKLLLFLILLLIMVTVPPLL